MIKSMINFSSICVIFVEQKFNIDNMKFNKEEAGKELIRKMTLNGETLSTSERSVNEALDIYIPKFATEETSLDEFVASILPLMTINENNMRNDNSKFVKSFEESKKSEIEELKEKLRKLEETNAQTHVDDKSDVGNKSEYDSKLDAILSEMNILKQQRLEDESKSTIAKKKERLTDILKQKGIKKETELNSYLHIVDITNDTDVDDVAERIVEAFNINKANINQNSSVNSSRGEKDIDYDAAFANL